MNIFINQTHLLIISFEKDIYPSDFSHSIDLSFEPLKYNLIQDNSLIQNPTAKDILEIIQLTIAEKLHLKTLTFQVSDFKETKQAIKKDFKIIEAGGGLVKKGDRFLMMYRLGKWDLPKGKMDEGENFKETALREVAEECNITVSLIDKLCTTWHFYFTGTGVPVLKQTKWFLMVCEDDNQMKPQTEEGIEQIQWMNTEEVQEALKNTYPAIAFAFEKYGIL